MLENTVNKTVVINASVAKVWDTITNPILIKQWVSDAEMSVTSDFKVGSPINFKGAWSNVEHSATGTILKFEKEKVFQYTSWSKITRLPNIPENHSLIEFTLSPDEGKVLLTVTHSNLIAKASYEHSNFYWSTTLQVIKKLAESK